MAPMIACPNLSSRQSCVPCFAVAAFPQLPAPQSAPGGGSRKYSLTTAALVGGHAPNPQASLVSTVISYAAMPRPAPPGHQPHGDQGRSRIMLAGEPHATPGKG